MGSVRAPCSPDSRACALTGGGRDCSNSTYTFSPVTGLINKHTIDSIQPAPHEAVFDLLRAALAKLRIGAAEPGGGVGVGGAACRAHAKGGGVGDEKGCT